MCNDNEHIHDDEFDTENPNDGKDILSQKVCECSTVKELIDEAADTFYKPREDGGCRVTELMVLSLLLHIHRNYATKRSIDMGMPEAMAVALGEKLMADMDETADQIMFATQDYTIAALNKACEKYRDQREAVHAAKH